MAELALSVRHLQVSFFGPSGETKVVRDVSIDVERGKVAGIVGESGCGKSMVARSIMGLIKHPGRVVGGTITLAGTEVTGLSERELAQIRGKDVSMVFQEPMTSLNPLMRVGDQVAEAVRLHEDVSRAEAADRALDMLAAVGIPEPAARYRAYPHELSGGLRQRVMIAMAMVCRPALLIADEPTTALDATVEAQILRLLRALADDGTAILIISHNLGVIAELADDVYVMYAGRVVEHADVCTLFDNPTHPYTQGLLRAVQDLRGGAEELATIPGTVCNLQHLPSGCTFHPRCALCDEACRKEVPEPRELAPNHVVCCHHARIGGRR